jgi:hypothetical protein
VAARKQALGRPGGCVPCNTAPANCIVVHGRVIRRLVLGHGGLSEVLSVSLVI